MRKIYLDNNATTPIHPYVKSEINRVLGLFGNPSSMHSGGRDAYELKEESREKIASFIGAEKEEIIFTSSGTEANNAVINNIFWNENNSITLNKDQQIIEIPHIITSSIEHPSILNTLEYYEKKGIEVTYLPVDPGGKVNPEAIRKEIRPSTKLITIMYANNEIGVIQPVKEIAEIAHERGVVFHTDAVQALGKLPINVDEDNIDMMTLSGHKIYAPKGIGVLYVKKGVRFMPLLYGGHHENHRRAGTENMIGIAAMGKAVELLKPKMNDDIKKMKTLKEKLKKGLFQRIPDISVNGDQSDSLPNTLNVSFDFIEGESILLYADFEGIELSTGSACSTGSLEPSHVIMALGAGPEQAHSSVRFSIGRENSEEDIDYVLQKLPPIIKKLRKMSPLFNNVS